MIPQKFLDSDFLNQANRRPALMLSKISKKFPCFDKDMLKL